LFTENKTNYYRRESKLLHCNQFTLHYIAEFVRHLYSGMLITKTDPVNMIPGI